MRNIIGWHFTSVQGITMSKVLNMTIYVLPICVCYDLLHIVSCMYKMWLDIVFECINCTEIC